MWSMDGSPGDVGEVTVVLKIFISDGHIDDNFLEKNLCHSRDSKEGLENEL